MTSQWLGTGHSCLPELAETKSEISRRGKLGGQGLQGEDSHYANSSHCDHIYAEPGQQECREPWTSSTLLIWGHREGGGAFHALQTPAPRLVILFDHSNHLLVEKSYQETLRSGGRGQKRNWTLGTFDRQLITWLLAPFLGHTYDRSITVDGEEASLMVYDIWEQVGFSLGHRERGKAKRGKDLAGNYRVVCAFVSPPGWGLLAAWPLHGHGRRIRHCILNNRQGQL